MPQTNGFQNSVALTDHFVKHRDDFGVTTEAQYEQLADVFCGGPMDANTTQHIRSSDGAILRYNSVTNEFGVVGTDGCIRTYFKPRQGIAYYLRSCT